MNRVESWVLREEFIAKYSGKELVWGSGEAAIKNARGPTAGFELLIARGWRVALRDSACAGCNTPMRPISVARPPDQIPRSQNVSI
jgi:hypothetical protein